MPAIDLSSYHQNTGTTSDGAKFNNMIDAVQATVNALDNNNVAAAAAIAVTKLADPGTGKVIGSGGTAAAAVYPPGYELHYSEITVTQNVVGTSSAAPTAVLAGSPVTYDGTAVVMEFGAVNLVRGTNNINVGLYEDGTLRSMIAFVGGATQFSGTFKHRLTPSAGAHTYSIRAWVDAGTGNVTAGAGTAGTNMPAFLRITKA